MKQISKEWCVEAAEREGNNEIGAGLNRLQTRGELRQAQLDGLRWSDAADRAWLEHKKTAREHVCSECFRAGFRVALLWYRSNKE